MRHCLNAVFSTNHEEIMHFMGVPQYVRQRDRASLSGRA
jgi:hypothetical protein